MVFTLTKAKKIQIKAIYEAFYNHRHYVTAFQCTLELEIFVFLIAFFRVKTLGNCLEFRYRNQRELELN